MPDISISAQGSVSIGEFVGGNKTVNNVQNIQHIQNTINLVEGSVPLYGSFFLGVAMTFGVDLSTEVDVDAVAVGGGIRRGSGAVGPGRRDPPGGS